MRCWAACLVQLLLIGSVALSQDVSAPVQHVSRTLPVTGPRFELSAERPQAQIWKITQPRAAGPETHTWQLLATLPGTILHDISFPTATIGYAAGEHGQIWKTTNGGKNWLQVLSAADNNYFYCLSTLLASKGFISRLSAFPPEPFGG